MRKHDVIWIFQDGGRGCLILVPVSHLLISVSSEGQWLSANQISRHFGWAITTSGLEKQTSAIWNSTSGFDLDHFDVIWMLLLSNFVQIGPPTADIWAFMRSYRFFKMAATGAQYYFRFVFVDVNAFRMSKSISKPNFVDKSQFMAEI